MTWPSRRRVTGPDSPWGFWTKRECNRAPVEADVLDRSVMIAAIDLIVAGRSRKMDALASDDHVDHLHPLLE